MIAALAAAVTGRRGRWVTIAVWVALGASGYVARSHIGEVTAAGQSSFLPKDSESTRALEALQSSDIGAGTSRGSETGGSGAEEIPALIVFYREGGLSEDDLRGIGRIGVGLNRLAITGATPIVDPFTADASESLGDVAE
ncbi:MAG TPA: hypothetical protein VEB65_06950, partial [Solirubrobacterales bacterium]|nr:hypothetical protein [Solirubrobacterales bacterium]